MDEGPKQVGPHLSEDCREQLWRVRPHVYLPRPTFWREVQEVRARSFFTSDARVMTVLRGV